MTIISTGKLIIRNIPLLAVLTAAGVLTAGCGSAAANAQKQEVPEAAGWEAIPGQAEPPVREAAEPASTEASEEESDLVITADDAGTESTVEESTEPGAMDELEQKLSSELESFSGEWSLFLKEMDTGDEIRINDQPMVAASLIKLYIAGTYFEEASDGTLPEGIDESSRLDLMINQSDNNAANYLIDLVGKDSVNGFCKKHGFPSSELNRKMLEASEKENYTSAADCGKVLSQVLNGTYVNTEASAELLQDLKDQQRTSKIPAGVPADVQTANKTGELNYVENDAAIIWAPARTYILCIMSSNAGSMADARQNIVNISSEVYETIGTE